MFYTDRNPEFLNDVQKIIRAAGADPSQLLKELQNDPVRQHMYYDLLMGTSYGAQLDKNELAFTT